MYCTGLGYFKTVGRESDTYSQLAVTLDSMKASYKKNLPKQGPRTAGDSVKEKAQKKKP